MAAIDFAALLARLPVDAVVRSLLPDGKATPSGRTWVALNPTRSDDNPGSFKVDLTTGRFKDFAGTERDSGGDVIALYQYVNGGTMADAARALAERWCVDGVTPTPAPKPKRDDGVAVFPVPDDAPKPPSRFFEETASRRWTYRDAAGRTLMHVCRFDKPDGEKDIKPQTWRRLADGSHRWMWRGWPNGERKPLYGMDVLAKKPDATVVIVEGEKSADAFNRLFADMPGVAVAWLGGTNTAKAVDVSPLKGRRVALWPDFDAQLDKATQTMLPRERQPGWRAMTELAAQLEGVAAAVEIIEYTPGEKAGGWDVADAADEGWTAQNVAAFISERSRPLAKPTAVTVAAPDSEPVAVVPLHMQLNPYTFVHVTDKGAPMGTLENCRYLLDSYGIVARYNEMSKSQEVTIPGRTYTQDNAANCALAEITSLATRNRMPKGDLQQFLFAIADEHAYNPVARWIDSAPWDGVVRLPEFIGTVRTIAGAEPMRDRLLFRWLLSAVAAVYEPNGVEAHGVLVLQGPQGVGKTSWLRRLADASIGAILTGATIDPVNKDTVITALSHWIVELGELDGLFRKADIARLKAFVTQSSDKVRTPYAREASHYARRTVFFGSVNEERYLVDETGNRRWWTIPVTSIDYRHGTDMQQLWAEVKAYYARGERWWLLPEEQEMLASTNADHEAVDPFEEQVLARFRWDDPYRLTTAGREMTATDVLLMLGYHAVDKRSANAMARVLTKLTQAPSEKRGGRRVFRLPDAK